jgi:hypothetical protein
VNSTCRFERIDLASFDWDRTLAQFPDRTPFQTSAWLKFLARTQPGEPVLAALREGNSTLGYLVGLVIRKWGARILGTPFPGWTTDYMGFNLAQGVPRSLALECLPDFAFRELGCVHVEGMDRHSTVAQVTQLGFDYQSYSSWEIDLVPAEEELFRAMRHSCRSNIRKAVSAGVAVEEAADLSFADEYYSQLREVFAKDGVVPPFGVERVRELIRCLAPTGMLLSLRARDCEGHCIATALFVGLHQTVYAWGAASRRKYQLLRPNELLTWHAMKYWKRRGCHCLDFGGAGEYKRKFGARSITIPWFRKSRYPLLEALRNSARELVQFKHRMWARWQGSGVGTGAPSALDE